MGELVQVQPIFVWFSYRITRLHYTYGCPTLKAAYVCKLYLQNHWGTLQLYVSNVTFSLLLCAPPIEKLGFTTLMGSPSYVRLTLATSTFKNHWGTLQLWVRHLKCRLCWLPPVSESLADTTLMDF